jgi:hypothetical protein
MNVLARSPLDTGNHSVSAPLTVLWSLDHASFIHSYETVEDCHRILPEFVQSGL